MLARSRRPRIRVFAAWSLACAALAALALPSVAQALNLPGRIAYVRCTTSLVDCPLVVRQADGSGGITTIDGDVGAETLIGRWPSFAPDGSAVAYLDRKPAVEMDFVPIAVAKTDGSGSTVIRNRGYGSPTWRPVGASVAFVDDPDDELPGQVRTISPTGGSESQLFDLDREPFVQPPGAPVGWLADSLQWLPGGSQLLLSANGPSTPGGPQDRSAFFLIPAGSGEFATLTPNTPGASFTAPRLSRDGARLAYVYADTSTAQQLRVRDLAGTSEVTVPIGALTIVEPHDFSPDGESVLISARDPASPSEVHLYVVAIDGGAPPARVFADGASHEASAAWFSESRPTAITSGPSGLTNQSAAQFSLTQVGAPVAGNFECRLDGAPFAPCSSTVSLPGLADGQHTFEARFVIAGGGIGPTVSRTWTVDATPPSV
ncbi:MAG: hypothetical protein JHD16_04125, partial [Solirubrobacteraceae bacterium]|nr:hypothetical protein [Solirubrobacteraceae bacterium]